MNLQQLSVFREVMESGSVSAAARKLHRTQPAVSASLKTLEETLGLKLFKREGRRLVPVPEALYLLNESTEILEQWATTLSNFKDLRSRQSGTLRVAAMPGTSTYLLPEFVSRFIADRPDVRVTMTTRNSSQILKLIAAQNYDLGFCDTFVDQPNSDLFDAKLFHGECMVAIRKGHPLAKKSSITIEDLDGMPIGTLKADHPLSKAIAGRFATAGAQFNDRIQALFFFPLFHFVEAGQIACIIDPMSVESYQQMNGAESKLDFVKFEPALQFGYSVITPKQQPSSLLAQEFMARWLEFVESIVDPVEDGALGAHRAFDLPALSASTTE